MGDVGRNLIPWVIPRVSSIFNYDYYISEIDNCPGYEVATPGFRGLHFSVIGTPGYTENQTKWQNELPIVSKVVSRIWPKMCFNLTRFCRSNSRIVFFKLSVISPSDHYFIMHFLKLHIEMYCVHLDW